MGIVNNGVICRCSNTESVRSLNVLDVTNVDPKARDYYETAGMNTNSVIMSESETSRPTA